MYVSLIVFAITGIYLMIVDPNYLGVGNFADAHQTENDAGHGQIGVWDFEGLHFVVPVRGRDGASGQASRGPS